MQSNLPPGVIEGKIPGNGGEDAAWESLHEWIDAVASKQRLDPNQIRLAFEMGLAALQKVAPQLRKLESLEDDLTWGYLKRIQPPDSK